MCPPLADFVGPDALDDRVSLRGGHIGYRSGPRVRLVVHCAQPRDRDMGVELGSGQAGMAQQFLHDAQISTALEQVGGRAVAQAVRTRIAGRASFAQELVDNPASGARVQATAAHAEEQGRSAAKLKGLRAAEYRLFHPHHGPESYWELQFFANADEPVARLRVGAKTGALEFIDAVAREA